MVRTIALGLLIAGITSISATNSSQSIGLEDRIQFSQPNLQPASESQSCDESNQECTVKPSTLKINSDLWLQKMASKLLPNALFLACNRPSSYDSDRASRSANSLGSVASSTWNNDLSLSSISTTVSYQCGFAWNKKLGRLVASAKQNQTQPKTVEPSLASVRFPRQFPKLSRSSLIVSFPQENSTFIPQNTKLANPAPATERIASPFGWRRRPYSNQLQFHQGIDYGAPYGSTVVSVGNGIVTEVVSGCADFGNLFCGGQLGNWIEVDHGNGIIGTYGHLKYNSIAVEPGTKVSKNQPIAQVGSSGWSTGAHLDFRLKVNGKNENPALYVREIGE